jgi:hypothetical protein
VYHGVCCQRLRSTVYTGPCQTCHQAKATQSKILQLMGCRLTLDFRSPQTQPLRFSSSDEPLL